MIKKFKNFTESVSEENEVVTDLGRKILTELDNAIKRFGVYTYHDKGASEIMELVTIDKELNDLSTQEVIDVLKYLLDNHQDSKVLVDDLVQNLDHREDFEDILDSDERFDY
jgi:hypothetical protein